MMVQQVADTKASVLILGENGTGKSLLAQGCIIYPVVATHHLFCQHGGNTQQSL